ncbi:nitrate- and nitrite sensing domain-containing protein [Colwellia sp. RE-S-Sl-9]
MTVFVLSIFTNAMQQPAVLEVEKLRKVAMEKSATGKFGIDASYWFEQATDRIKQLNKLKTN